MLKIRTFLLQVAKRIVGVTQLVITNTQDLELGKVRQRVKILHIVVIDDQLLKV